MIIGSFIAKGGRKEKKAQIQSDVRFVDERNRYICFLDFLCEI